MASRRRRRKGIGKVLTSVERKVRRIEKRPGPKRIKVNSITTEKIVPRAIETKKIATDAVTPNEADFGVTFVTDTEPTEYLKEGTTWFDPTDGSVAVYDPASSDFIDMTAIDYTARASADGKNTVYRQDSEPSGGTYVLGDVWFDTDDSNKIYRYSTAITATVTNKELSGNVATLTVSSAHTFVVGETITVSGVDATFNGSYTVTATPTVLTVRYAKTASPVSSTPSSGTITNTAGWKGFQLGDGALLNISANKITAGTIDASVITVSNLDAGNITTGTLTGRAISGGTISGAVLSIGSGSTYLKISTDGLQFGNTVFASAPFRVTSDASFVFGGGIISGTTNTVTFDLSSSGNSIVFSNMPSNDDDNWSGDPTITIRDSDSKIVKGRRLIYDGSLTSASTVLDPASLSSPYAWDSGSKTGYYLHPSGYRPVKAGDLLLIRE